MQLDGGGLNHRVEGNEIGAAGLPNDEGGVVVSSSFTVVTGNMVSDNSDAGIMLDYCGLGQPLVGNVVEDNEVTGNAKGVVVEDSHVNAVTDNVISGNAGEGVLIAAVDLHNADGNWLTGNTITGNGSSGVRIDAADESSVGAVGGDVNVISGNGGDGVTVTTGQDNAVVNNSIYDNGDLGIDLVDDGPTANDGLGDPDGGPNLQQNHPTISGHQLVIVQLGGAVHPEVQDQLDAAQRGGDRLPARVLRQRHVRRARRGQGAARDAAGDHRWNRPRPGLDRLRARRREGDGQRHGDRSERLRGRPDLGAQRLRLT